MNEKPLYILPEDAQRFMGKDAQRNNILAARILAETIKTTLGPKGMDKMLISSTGDIIITNDGVTILEEMEVEHPIAKMIIEIAKTQDKEVGDGTTTVVMLAGKLLENAEKLLDKKVHPTIITRGYKIAEEASLKILNELAIEISTEDELLKVAQTAMTGKGAEYLKEKFSKIVVEAVKTVAESNNKIDLDDIKIEKKKGDSAEKTELIKGIVLDKTRISEEMPASIKEAKIALIDCALEIKAPERETRISISSPDQLQSFLNQEEEILKNMVVKLKSVGANVVVCQKGVDDIAQFYLAKAGIYTLRRVARSDLQKLAKATGARINSNLKELAPNDLGYASLVQEVKHGEESFTYVQGCKNPKAVTIMIHGGSEHVTAEIQRAISDALGDVAATLKDSKIVAGGGAIEIELARKLREFAQSLKGREQLAVEEFADAIEFVPVTLAENAGLDPLDILTELRVTHEAGNKNFGLNLFNEKIEDTALQGIIEPLKIKTLAISSATEVAIMILRIDDIIASGKSRSSTKANLNSMANYE